MRISTFGRSLSTAAIALLLVGCADELPIGPSAPDVHFNRKGGPSPAPAPYSWTLGVTANGLSSDGRGSYVAGQCGVSGQVYYGASDDAVLSINSGDKKCARTVGLMYPSGFRQVGMFANLTQAAAIPAGASMRRRLILNPGQFNRNDECGRIIFGNGGVNDVGAGSDSVMVERSGNTWTITGEALRGWCEKRNVLVTSDVNFVISNQ